MSSLRWGIVGTGGIAHTFARDLVLTQNSVVSAVGSRTEESAKRFAEEFNVPASYGSYEELVLDPTVDVVYIATPHPMHLANASLALNAGKPVLVEKAFTMNADEARALVALARDKGLFMMEAMWTRFLPHVIKIRELIAEGAIGRVMAFEADHGKYFVEDAGHRLYAPELGGSALLDLGIYPISFASMIMGTPSRIVSMVDPAFTGVDGFASMIFGYESGRQSILTTMSSARSATRACITGELARIEIAGDFYAPSSFALIQRDGQREEFTFPREGRGLNYQVDEVARCLRDGLLESPIMSLDETISIMETIDTVMSAMA
jgi:predicted dehydrogenase